LCAAKADLGRLVTLETGKIVSEGLGEVQEMIDICDYRRGPVTPALYGRHDRERCARRAPHDGDLASARCVRRHLGLQLSGRRVGLECRPGLGLRRPRGLQKPSDKTPLTAIATQAIVARAMRRFGDAPGGTVGGSDRRA